MPNMHSMFKPIYLDAVARFDCCFNKDVRVGIERGFVFVVCLPGGFEALAREFHVAEEGGDCEASVQICAVSEAARWGCSKVITAAVCE